MGLGREEARYWHRRIYSGTVRNSPKPRAPQVLHQRARLTRAPLCQTPLVQALPADIGAASAYEAYRMWKRNTFLYEPLSADRVAQREGLIGMAIGEGAFRAWRARTSTC